jgi:exodeoxyribonuclease V alpha subunit
MEAVSDGHCALPEENLLTLAEELLEIGRGTLAEALTLEAAEGEVVIDHIGDTACVFLPHLRKAEDVVASIIRRLQVGTPPWPLIDPVKALPWVEAQLGVTLRRDSGTPSAWRCPRKFWWSPADLVLARPRSSGRSCTY